MKTGQLQSCFFLPFILHYSFNRMNLAPESIGLIAGNRSLPLEFARLARAAGVKRIVCTAAEGETDPALASLVDDIVWLKVGQLGKMISAFTGPRREAMRHGSARLRRKTCLISGPTCARWACCSGSRKKTRTRFLARLRMN